MNLEFIPTLADAIKYYYEDRELEDLGSAFSVAVDRGAYMALAEHNDYGFQGLHAFAVGSNGRSQLRVIPTHPLTLSQEWSGYARTLTVS